MILPVSHSQEPCLRYALLTTGQGLAPTFGHEIHEETPQPLTQNSAPVLDSFPQCPFQISKLEAPTAPPPPQDVQRKAPAQPRSLHPPPRSPGLVRSILGSSGARGASGALNPTLGHSDHGFVSTFGTHPPQNGKPGRFPVGVHLNPTQILVDGEKNKKGHTSTEKRTKGTHPRAPCPQHDC